MSTYTDTLAANQQYVTNVVAGKASANRSSTSDSSSATSAQTKLSGDLNFFLTLLTTQLRHQDPTQPLDTNQVTQQIAMLSGVQQQVNTNINLEKLIAAGKQSQLSTAVSYIGKEIETPGNTGAVLGGQGAFSYSLPSAAARAQVTITDATGRTVFKGAGTTLSGRNIIIWEGTNSFTGAREPDGTYTLSVSATDANGKVIQATPAAVGIVTAVQSDGNGGYTLNLGNVSKNLSDVVAVRAPSRVNTSTAQNGINNATN